MTMMRGNLIDDVHERFDLKRTKHLSLPSGGTMGVTNPGVFHALEVLGIMDQIEDISATSIGTLMAVGPAVGLPTAYMIRRILEKTASGHLPDFLDFLPVEKPNIVLTELEKKLWVLSFFASVENQFALIKLIVLRVWLDFVKQQQAKPFYDKWLRYVKQALRVIPDLGIFLGEHIEKEVTELLVSSHNKLPLRYRTADLTLGQLHELKIKFPALYLKDLYFTMWDTVENKGVIVSWKTHPTMKVKHAVRNSMAIPGVIQPGNHRYLDGFLHEHLPLCVFDDAAFLTGDDRLSRAGLNMRALGLSYTVKSEDAGPFVPNRPIVHAMLPRFFKLPFGNEKSDSRESVVADDKLTVSDQIDSAVKAAHEGLVKPKRSVVKKVTDTVLKIHHLKSEIHTLRGGDQRIFKLNTRGVPLFNFNMKVNQVARFIASSYRQTLMFASQAGMRDAVEEICQKGRERKLKG